MLQEKQMKKIGTHVKKKTHTLKQREVGDERERERETETVR